MLTWEVRTNMLIGCFSLNETLPPNRPTQQQMLFDERLKINDCVLYY